MKGAYGLLIALALGAAGAMLNWYYLERRGREFDKVSFVAVKRAMKAGEVLRKEDLMQVDIPRQHVGKLPAAAYLWSSVDTLPNMPVSHELGEGEIILRQHTVAPAGKGRQLLDHERLLAVPVDQRAFVPVFFKAGDMVDFLVPKAVVAVPAGGAPSGGGAPAVQQGTESIGPFEIWAVGNRVSDAEIARSARQQITQQNVLNVVVKIGQDGELEPKAQKLANLLVNSNLRNLVVVAKPKKEETAAGR